MVFTCFINQGGFNDSLQLAKHNVSRGIHVHLHSLKQLYRKEAPVAFSNVSSSYYSDLESKGLCDIYLRQALGVEKLVIYHRFFLAEVCFLWGQPTITQLFCFLFWEHMPILWCPKSPSISSDLPIHIWLNSDRWTHWRGRALTLLSRLNHSICYQLSSGKTVTAKQTCNVQIKYLHYAMLLINKRAAKLF